MYIHLLHCSTPGFPTLTAKVKANVFLRTLWIADELQDYMLVALSSEEAFFCWREDGRMEKESARVR